jgi:hypothetical protein
VFHQNAASGLHQVAAPDAALHIGLLLPKGLDEVGAVQVARGFAGDEIEFQSVVFVI